MFSTWKFEPAVPFLLAMIVAKNMKCACPHFHASQVMCTPVVYLNICLMFGYILYLSLPNFNHFISYLFPYFHFITIPLLSFLFLNSNIFCNVIYIFWLHFIFTKSIWLFYFLSRYRFKIKITSMYIKGHVFFQSMLLTSRRRTFACFTCIFHVIESCTIPSFLVAQTVGVILCVLAFYQWSYFLKIRQLCYQIATVLNNGAVHAKRFRLKNTKNKELLYCEKV